MARQLAVIDHVTADPIKVNRYQSLLRQLSIKYSEPEVRISDMTVGCSQMLLKKGIVETNISILEGMNQILPAQTADLTYGKVLAMYMALRDNSESHQNTVEGLAEILNNPKARQTLLNRLRH